MENGYFLHPDKQIKMACDLVNSDPLLADGFNALGFSQGAQFLYYTVVTGFHRGLISFIVGEL